MKTVLYATDFSQSSVSAFHFASFFAKTFNAQLIVMHVFDTPVSFASTVSISYLKREKKLFVEQRTKLETFCHKHLTVGFPEVSPKFVVLRNGSIISGIREKALEAHADLITVGTKGGSEVKEFFMGSTTKGLLIKSPCPVLAVPPEFIPSTIKTMAYASDFDRSDVYAILKLVKIATVFNSLIRIVHISTKKEIAGRQQMEWFKEMVRQKVDYDHMAFDFVSSGEIADGLNRYIENSNTDLLAMLQRKDDTILEKYLRKDLLQQMVGEMKVPLLGFNILDL